jgi:hypothetical protein
LDEVTRHWLEQDGANSAARFRFQYGDEGPSGLVLIIVSDSWHGHHNPERCFIAEGLRTVNSEGFPLDGTFSVRRLLLNTSDGANPHSGAYWYQSRERTVDDYAGRIWADMGLQREKWVLVTILFDSTVDWHAEATQQMLRDLNTVVAASDW